MLQFFHNLQSGSINLFVRQSSSNGGSSSCTSGNNSPQCELPAKSNSGLAIGLGVAIPCVIAFIMFTLLAIRHRRLVKKEDEEASKIDTENDDALSQISLKPDLAFYKNNNDLNGPKTPYEKDHFDTINGPHPPLPTASKLALTAIGDNPFTTPGSPYQIPELSSSQVSLNNCDPFDQARYPPSGEIYQSTSPAVRRPNQSFHSNNPYGNLNSAKYVSSSQELNAASASTLSVNSTKDTSYSSTFNPNKNGLDQVTEQHEFDHQHTPDPPFRRRASDEGSSTLSVVSSHTPTTATAPAFPAPESANVHGETDDFESPPSSPVADQSNNYAPNSIQKKNNSETAPIPNPSVPRKDVQSNQKDLNEKQTSGENEENSTRSDPKNFDRVKSVYKEYFPSEMHSPEHKPQENFGNIPEHSLENNQTTHHATQDELDAQYGHQHVAHATPENPLNPPAASSPNRKEGQPFAPSFSKPSLPSIDTNLSMPSSTAPRTVNSEVSNRSTGHVVHNYVNKFELTDLPGAHNVSDNVSVIEYNKARRAFGTDKSSAHPESNTPGGSSTNGPATASVIPVYNPLDNNLMYPENDKAASNIALPTPSQLRQSVSYMTNLEFQRPKKYNLDYSNSLNPPSSSSPSPSSSPSLNATSGNRPSTPARAMIGIASRVRPPSELVPDTKSQFDKLRPTMEMR